MNTENAYVICRLCGYIEKVSEADKPCPACGAPSTAFIPYEYKASDKRRLYLKFDIHPIMTHFIVSFTITATLLFFLSFSTSEILGVPIGYGGVLELLVPLLPLLVTLGGITGMIDGKVRYRKLQTKFLIRKIIIGSVFFVVAVLLLIVHTLSNSGTDSLFVFLEATLLVASVVCATLLGLIGADLLGNIVPRGREKK
ncbi:MAG: rubredoxin-like domain-containing protein [Candidatus Hodarchaeales archaeon]